MRAPELKSFRVSTPKLENVVKPPKKPTINKGGNQLGVLAGGKKASSPMRKQPITLQARTPIGNFSKGEILNSHELRANLDIAPSPPPRKTNKYGMAAE